MAHREIHIKVEFVMHCILGMQISDLRCWLAHNQLKPNRLAGLFTSFRLVRLKGGRQYQGLQIVYIVMT